MYDGHSNSYLRPGSFYYGVEEKESYKFSDVGYLILVDGDQVTCKILFTQEANEELRKYMQKKSFIINGSGVNIRKIENEAGQTFFTMTKNPTAKDRTLTQEEKAYFLALSPEDCTFDNLVSWFGKTTDTVESDRNLKVSKPKFKLTDKMTLTHADYPMVKDKVNTTLGRFLYNKILVESIGADKFMEYTNDVQDDDGFGDLEKKITGLLRDDKLSTEALFQYFDTRDWLGLQFHGVVTTSFTQDTIRMPASVKALKKKLLAQYKDEIAAGDERVYEQIEKQLVDEAKRVTADNIGMDLYISGARGTIGNNYKSMFISRGAVKNPATGKFDIITNSLTEGLQRKDLTPHSNTIVTGSFPKSVKLPADYKPCELLEPLI